MRIVLTGAAGFIGFHVASALLARGDVVLGIDNLNAYYDIRLKAARLEALERLGDFRFVKADCADPEAFLAAAEDGADLIVHLAAQAGVRHSLVAPLSYVDANVRGQVVVLQHAANRSIPVVYASSSSVYGTNKRVPFAETDRVDSPASLYAATKRAGELAAAAFRETHGLRSTGLRFFTVYGTFGRPDMAYWLFADAILDGRPIEVFDGGVLERDFTSVSDIVRGVVAAIDRAANPELALEPVYNLGRGAPVRTGDLIATIEAALGRKATVVSKRRPPGEVILTHADITFAARDLGYSPVTDLGGGMAEFVAWLKHWKAL
jgi:UDP-glucuronate 4-epimerase